MSAEAVVDLDLALRALADGNRRAILRVIRADPQSVGVIAEEVGLSQQTASHHLGVLRKYWRMPNSHLTSADDGSNRGRSNSGE